MLGDTGTGAAGDADVCCLVKLALEERIMTRKLALKRDVMRVSVTGWKLTLAVLSLRMLVVGYHVGY